MGDVRPFQGGASQQSIGVGHKGSKPSSSGMCSTSPFGILGKAYLSSGLRRQCIYRYPMEICLAGPSDVLIDYTLHTLIGRAGFGCSPSLDHDLLAGLSFWRHHSKSGLWQLGTRKRRRYRVAKEFSNKKMNNLARTKT